MGRISIVIPCYRELNRFPDFLKELILIKDQIKGLEFLIVDDGTPKVEFEQLKEKISPLLSENVRLYHYDQNRGKGYAIAYGLTHASGTIIGFVDCDGAIPAYEVIRLSSYFLNAKGVDLIAGSRILMQGKKVERGIKRHIFNRIFATFFSTMFQIKMYDSQCGIKLFRKELYLKIKDKIKDERWLWDTQLIIQFFINKFRIEEIPIDWIDQPGSKVRLLSDSLKMFLRLLKYKLALKKMTG